ncbi:hypothetical protein GCM10020256_00720 [Streptomyces thermocoprophilus]
MPRPAQSGDAAAGDPGTDFDQARPLRGHPDLQVCRAVADAEGVEHLERVVAQRLHDPARRVGQRQGVAEVDDPVRGEAAGPPDVAQVVAAVPADGVHHVLGARQVLLRHGPLVGLGEDVVGIGDGAERRHRLLRGVAEEDAPAARAARRLDDDAPAQFAVPGGEFVRVGDAQLPGRAQSRGAHRLDHEMFVAPRGAEGGAVARQAEPFREQVRELHPALPARDHRDRRERLDSRHRGLQVAVVHDIGDEILRDVRRCAVQVRNVTSALHPDNGTSLFQEFQDE